MSWIFRTLIGAIAAAFVLTADINRSSSKDAGTAPRPKEPLASEGASVPKAAALRPLAELVDEVPDGQEITAIFKAAKTVDDIRSANQFAKTQVAKARSAESELTRLHLALVKSCEASRPTDSRAQLQAMAVRVRSLKTAISEVDGAIKKSLESMRRQSTSEKPSTTAFKLSQEVMRYDTAYSEFGQVRVDISEIDKAFSSLATIVLNASTTCNPAAIPPLFALENPATVTTAQAQLLPAQATRKARQKRSRPRCGYMECNWPPE